MISILYIQIRTDYERIYQVFLGLLVFVINMGNIVSINSIGYQRYDY